MMDYLQQIFGKIFGYGGGEQNNAPGPRKIIAFGNILLDRTVKLQDTTLLDRFDIPLGSKGELNAETLARLTADASEGTQCVSNPGGSAMNTVRILRQLGTEALFFGAVGNDKIAEELKHILEELQVLSRLQTAEGVPTGQCICLIHDDQSTLYANIGASSHFTVQHLKSLEREESQTFLRSIERKQIIYIEGFFIPEREQVCEYITHHYIRERRRLAFNLSAVYIVKQNYKTIKFLTEKAFFIFGNEMEFQALAEQMGRSSIEVMAKELLQNGNDVKVIVITKGANGVLLVTNYVDEYTPPGEITFQSFNTHRVENVLDPTGAGDAFVAAFLHAFLQKRSLSESVRIGIDVAAKVVTQIGCNLPNK